MINERDMPEELRKLIEEIGEEPRTLEELLQESLVKISKSVQVIAALILFMESENEDIGKDENGRAISLRDFVQERLERLPMIFADLPRVKPDPELN